MRERVIAIAKILAMGKKVIGYFEKGSEDLNFGERRYYMWAPMTCILATLYHVIFIAIFWAIGVTPLVYFNIISVLLWIFAIFLNRKKLFLLAISVQSIELFLHMSLAVISVGWGSGFQYHFIFVPFGFFNLPGRGRLSIFVSVLSWVIYVLLYIFYSAADPLYTLSSREIFVLHTINLTTLFFLISVFIFFYSKVATDAEKAVQVQFNRAESLLTNILPGPVAERLKEEPGPIAEGFEQVSILFADIYRFTEFSSSMHPNDLVNILNNLFSAYDDLLEKYNVEKIKTIGDAYMIASGLPHKSEHHAENIIDYAIEMMLVTKEFNQKFCTNFSLRIGINSGPVTAGVIGKKKFIYDLWGDTVNVASRMESSGIPGTIQITHNTYKLIKEKYNIKKCEAANIKGKGLMQTYIVHSKKYLS